MNIVSVTISAALMGLIAPGVAQMAIMPVLAQKRAGNFGVAESRAVAYAALGEGAPDLPPTNTLQFDGCVAIKDQTTGAGTVTCTFPKPVNNKRQKFAQTVSRSFRLAQLQGGNSGYTAPRAYTPGVFCPLWDAWGIINYNDSHNVQCIPVPYGPWASSYTGEMLW